MACRVVEGAVRVRTRKKGGGFSIPAVVAAVFCVPLLFSCASTADMQPEDPFSVLLPSSEGLSPSAYMVLPPEFMLRLLRENLPHTAALPGSEDGRASNGIDGVDDSLVKTLDDFFSRASKVSSVFMYDGGSGAFSFRLLALGDFPKGRFNMALSASSGWTRFKIGDATCFNSGDFFVSVPSSGILMAVVTSGRDVSGVTGMTDMLAALDSLSGNARSSAGGGAAGIPAADIPSSFETAALSAWSGAENAPFSFYSGNLPSLLPVFFAGNPVFDAHALGALEIKMPLESAEAFVFQGELPADGTPRGYTLNVRIDTVSERFAAPAGVLLQMVFPGTKIVRDGGSFFIEKNISGSSLALALFSLFLVS